MSISPLLGWKSAREVITWVAPAVGIPALRYLNDRHEQRRELFFRDASTYALGTGIYFAVGILAHKAFNRLKLFAGEPQRNFAAFLLAIAANILYAGIGAVKLSHWMTRNDPPSWRNEPFSQTWPRGLGQPPQGFSSNRGASAFAGVPAFSARRNAPQAGLAFSGRSGGFSWNC